MPDHRCPHHASFRTPPKPSFRTKQADSFFPFASRERVGLRREESLPAWMTPAPNSREQTFPTNKDRHIVRMIPIELDIDIVSIPCYTSACTLETPRQSTQVTTFAQPSALPFHHLTPLQSALTESTSITLLESALTNPLDLKFFRIRTYRKPRGRGPKRLTTIQVAQALLFTLIGSCGRPRSQAAQQPTSDQSTRRSILRSSPLTTHYSLFTAYSPSTLC